MTNQPTSRDTYLGRPLFRSSPGQEPVSWLNALSSAVAFGVALYTILDGGAPRLLWFLLFCSTLLLAYDAYSEYLYRTKPTKDVFNE